MMKDIFKDALPILEEVAPMIARLIGGYPAIAAEYLLPALTKVVGSHGDVGQLAKDIVSKDFAQQCIKDFEHEHSDVLHSLLENINKLSSAEINLKLNFNKKD